MFRWISRFLPRRIAGQIIVLIVTAVVLFQAASAALLFAVVDRGPPPRPGLNPPALADRFADFVRLLDELPATARMDVVHAMQKSHPMLRLETARADDSHRQASRSVPASAEERELLRHIGRALGPGLAPPVVVDSTAADRSERERRNIAVTLRDGLVVTASLSFPRGPPRQPWPVVLILLTLGLITTMMIALLWWAAQAITAPLARFAGAAEDFSLDRQPAPLPEKEGPAEVQTASRALNRLQARIHRMVDGRTRMLAAVGHDLRTPITRMRLRAEFIEQEDVRQQMFRDLEQMERMINGVLSYLRDGRSSDRQALIDVVSLLQTVVDDFADLGNDVTLEGPAHLLMSASGDDVQRAVTNLVDNALKYGGSAAIRLQQLSSREIAVEVIDSGPGIPDHLKQEMLEPFIRADTACNLNDTSSGFGLGLAIVRATAEAHGGRLELLDHAPSGLKARLVLPTRLDADRT
jgi:signal transduction histidine kinase